MNVLVTGGAGYIGSHVARVLAAAGHRCVSYDSLVTGHRQAVAGELIVADVADGQALRKALRDHAIEAVIHLAAFIEAAESVQNPGKYFANNALATLTLLEAMRDCTVGKLVFSSTAAVYGQPRRLPIEETDAVAPINPYGASKLCAEYTLHAYAEMHRIGCVSLRYFNVAGADPAGDIGEAHAPETHLVPRVLQVALGQAEHAEIFGDDYDTPDGTCIRDYIHVTDLAAAHVLALGAIRPGQVRVYNLGNGEGFSVRQVIDTCCQVTGRAIPTRVAPRRAGDPPRLVASSAKAAKELSWQPKFAELATIVEHAWAWHRTHPRGYH
jgi:UDP-glucose-4-epimerase GalE